MARAVLLLVVFVLHELLRPDHVEARDYQLALARAAASEPLLVVLPTGLGKTVVALLAMLRRMEAEPDLRALVLAPTKPLVEQHGRFLREALTDTVEVACLTGEKGPAARAEVWSRARVVCATPQVVHNDVLRGALDLDRFGLLVLDEAHRGVGNYPYVFLAQRFRGHRIGLTASPGTDLAAIRRVLENLRLTRTEVRTEDDPDVRAHVHEVHTEWVRVPPNGELVETARLLQRSLNQAVLGLRRTGFLDHVPGPPGRKQLVELGRRLRAEASGGRAGPSVYQAMSLQAKALKIEHAVELCETQGPGCLARFLERMLQDAQRAGGSKAAREWTATEEFARALDVARASKEPHPKAARLVRIVEDQLRHGARRVLVFANFRETADDLVARLGAVAGARVDRFVGHAKGVAGRGLTKREQQRAVDAFRSGATNVLVATSVGEEGLDLPECDAVVLYEPVASGIRMVQRRGRTGRRSDGRLFVLMTDGTRDTAYYWSARRREQRMRRELHALRRAPPVPVEPVAPSVAAAAPSAPVVVVDSRESQSPLVRRLLEDGVRTKVVALPVGDYRIGEAVVVERKTVEDLAASIVDGRFFDQVPRLAATGRGLLLVEGALDGTRSLSRNALAGAAASAFLDHGVALVVVPGADASADFLAALARRVLRGERDSGPPARPGKAPPDAEGQVRHLFEGLPGVGPVLAERVRRRFGSMEALCRADVAALAEVEGVGPMRAAEIHRALRSGAPASPVEADAAEHLPLQAGDGAAG